METYLRMMYLKTKYQLGYESLVAEVTDSVSWQRFCRIGLSGRAGVVMKNVPLASASRILACLTKLAPRRYYSSIKATSGVQRRIDGLVD